MEIQFRKIRLEVFAGSIYSAQIVKSPQLRDMLDEVGYCFR